MKFIFIFIFNLIVLGDIVCTKTINIHSLEKFHNVIVLHSDFEAYTTPISSLFIESRSVSYFRFSGFLFEKPGIRRIQIVGSTSQILKFKVQTIDIGNERQQFLFSKKTSDIIDLIETCDFITITVFDKFNNYKTTKISTTLFNKLKSHVLK